MDTFLIILVILLSSILSFLVGYSSRKHQEEKMKKRVWINIVKRLHVINPLSVGYDELGKEDKVDQLNIETLKNDLRIALSNEDYEEAAKIRDLINKFGL
tara:strand:- start:7553 stop:7852 length:300 start_codon:yes stop_codon:yes gene_type:complete